MSSYYYERMGEDFEMQSCPIDDKDGSITKQAIVYADGSVGYKSILNVPKFFDENPEIRKALGWVKHITYDDKEIQEEWPHTQSQFVVKTIKQIDEYTIEDEYHVLDKSEEQMAFEEMLEVAMPGGFIFY